VTAELAESLRARLGLAALGIARGRGAGLTCPREGPVLRIPELAAAVVLSLAPSGARGLELTREQAAGAGGLPPGCVRARARVQAQSSREIRFAGKSDRRTPAEVLVFFSLRAQAVIMKRLSASRILRRGRLARRLPAPRASRRSATATTSSVTWGKDGTILWFDTRPTRADRQASMFSHHSTKELASSERIPRRRDVRRYR